MLTAKIAKISIKTTNVGIGGKNETEASGSISKAIQIATQSNNASVIQVHRLPIA